MAGKLRMWLVKREVLATSVQKALTARGIVYSIELASDENQPQPKRPIQGFTKK